MTDTTSSADAQVEAVRRGYAFTGPALELGALLADGQPLPDVQVRVPLEMLNRHGLVAGATGTGKTKTLQLMAEQLVGAGRAGVPGRHQGRPLRDAAAGPGRRQADRAAARHRPDLDAHRLPDGVPALGGLGTGRPGARDDHRRSGPTLLAKVLDLNETQESSLGLVFHYADQAGLPLLDLKDLRAVIQLLDSATRARPSSKGLGGLSPATAGVILRELIELRGRGRATSSSVSRSSTPADLLRTAPDGRGVTCLELTAVQDRPAAVLHVPHVAARGPLPRPARGRRPRQAEARLLLRRGAPAVQRTRARRSSTDRRRRCG